MKIIHLSDLHFGTEWVGIVDILLKDIQQVQPDIIIISGDLTQRARDTQFKAAKAFIQKLPHPVVCVPGNHDITLYNIIERFLYPFSKNKEWISPTLCVHHNVSNVAILGINSVTPFKVMSGYVTDKQLHMVEDYFKQQAHDQINIVVMHHNLIRSQRHKIINDAEKIIDVFAKCNVDIVLSGHIHAAHIEVLKQKVSTNPMYVVTAGTAISNRTMEPNSYNVIELHHKQFTLSVRSYTKKEFVASSGRDFDLRK
jgi:3',5'-cyclic AMP phosphodiesterase CpdA